MTVKLDARSRLHGDTDAEPHEFTAEGADYDEAYAAARDSVPAGWDLLSVQRTTD